MTVKKQLFDAAELGSISKLRAVLSSTSIDEVNQHGETPLMVACKFGHIELVKFILSRGANASLIDHSGKTVLDFVASSSNPEMASLFNEEPEIDSNKSQSLRERLVSLAINILSVFKDSNFLFEGLDENTRNIVKFDLAKIILLIRDKQELSMLDGLGLALLTNYFSSKSQLEEIVSILQKGSDEKVLELANKLLATARKLRPTSAITEKNFLIESTQFFNSDEANRIRKVFYEFSEVMVKADGVVSKEEAKTLKFLSKQLFASNDEEDANRKIAKVSLESIFSELNSLVGMDEIKNEINSLINIIRANQLRKKEGLPEQRLSMHSVFIGPPGTGKTTIARMMAEIYFALNVLNENNFVEVDRSGMVAGYVGQTAIKTDEVISRALNGVLFIDEAYTLAKNNSEGDFGQEAIDILLKRMEDNRDKLVVIVAGYGDEMKAFINSNPGLASRFNRYFCFSDYTPPQLVEIYKRITDAAGFILSDNAFQEVKKLFEILYAKKDSRFGNARLVRNIFEKTFEKHSNRTAIIAPITRLILTTIEKEDIPFIEFAQKA